MCILRVWEQDDALVVRIHSRSDVESPSTDRQWTAGDVESALDVVRAFLLDFAKARADGRSPPAP